MYLLMKIISVHFVFRDRESAQPSSYNKYFFQFFNQWPFMNHEYSFLIQGNRVSQLGKVIMEKKYQFSSSASFTVRPTKPEHE